MNMGEILLNIGGQHVSAAEDWIRKALEENRRNGMMFHLGMDHVLYAEWFRRQENRAKARENLAKASEIFNQCGADGWVRKYEKELALLA